MTSPKATPNPPLFSLDALVLLIVFGILLILTIGNVWYATQFEQRLEVLKAQLDPGDTGGWRAETTQRLERLHTLVEERCRQ